MDRFVSTARTLTGAARGRWAAVAAAALALTVIGLGAAVAPAFGRDVRQQFGIGPADAGSRQWSDVDVQSLDGRGNNIAHPDWGRAGAPYSRIAPARYAD